MATTAKASAIGVKDVVKQVQPMIEHLAGFIVGSLAVNMANKVLKVDPNDTSQKLKKVIPPVAVSAGALFGATKIKQPMLKNVFQGAAIAGAYKTAKALMPTATFLAGDGVNGLGLTPVSAVSNNDRWLYHEKTPISGMGFPDLGDVQPPSSGSGYYIDAPAYMGEPEPADPYMGEPEQMSYSSPYMQGMAEEQFYGNDDDLGQSEYEPQIYGDDMEIL